MDASGVPVLVLNHLQVTGVEWGLRQEDDPIRAGLLADAVGTAKTIFMLFLILFSARR